jgi:hypothetical protein
MSPEEELILCRDVVRLDLDLILFMTKRHRKRLEEDIEQYAWARARERYAVIVAMSNQDATPSP